MRTSKMNYTSMRVAAINFAKPTRIASWPMAGRQEEFI
jgi:hypothetical protein